MALNRRRAASEKSEKSTPSRPYLSSASLRQKGQHQSKGAMMAQTTTMPTSAGEEHIPPRFIPSRNAPSSVSFSGTSAHGKIFGSATNIPNTRTRSASLPHGARFNFEATEEGDEEGSLETEVSLYEDSDGKVKGVVELSTLGQSHVPTIKVRVLCLIDVSGSMLLKGDKQQKRSKISILKDMAIDIIDALEDDEDFFGVMTFGEKSRVICPLELVTSSWRTEVKTKVRELDQGQGFSAVTDLSTALVDAVHMLADAQQSHEFIYRNCIIVFSDGEVNAGITDPRDLVHATREKIREYAMPAEMLADLWVNISCVTTGSYHAHSLYMLSKLCGSDAYFYVDGSTDHPETDMLIPLILRKTACAQMVSVNVQAKNGAVLETHKCSQEYSVRRRRGKEVNDRQMAYFIHDMPTGIAKTFQLSLNVENSSSEADKVEFLLVDVQYVDALGMLYNVRKTIRRQHVLSLMPGSISTMEVVQKTAVSHLRQVFQEVCRNVAAILLEDASPHMDDSDDVRNLVREVVKVGKEDVKQLLTGTVPNLTDRDLRAELENFAAAIEANLVRLEELVGRHAAVEGKCWQYTKAMASAVSRELPTVSNVLARPQVVCPLPQASESTSKRVQALSIYVFGGEEDQASNGPSPLQCAARNVAQCLADVIQMVESSV